jgi:hypothetical protein
MNAKPTKTASTPISADDFKAVATVIVEQTIAEIPISSTGIPALYPAMEAVAKHVLDNRPNDLGGTTYRFMGLMVTVESGGSSSDTDLAAWLRENRPHIWADWEEVR